MSIKFSFPVNTIDFSTNKGKKPPKITIESSRIAIRYDDLNIVVLRPAIDRLTFGFAPDQHFLNKYSPGTTLAEYREYIKNSLYHEGKCNYEGLSAITSGVSFKKQPYSSYNVNLRYKPSGSNESILIQIDPKKAFKAKKKAQEGEEQQAAVKSKQDETDSTKAFMRFDLNPQRLSKQAIEQFRTFIADNLLVMPGGGDKLSYDDFLIWCPIYRADVCVDVLGARPSDLEIWSATAKKVSPAKSHVYKSATGRTETVYPKTKKWQSDTEYFYDKRKQQIEEKQQPVYGDFLHSRYESRIQKTTFHKLANIKNRCIRISVRALDTAAFDKLHHTQKLFIRYVLARNLEKALALIPAKQQAKFKKAYEDNMQPIWDAKKIWGFWKDTVAKSALFPKK